MALKAITLETLRPVAEKEQVAAIAHADGVQRMVVTTAFDLEEKERAVWLLPVPGTGDAVKIEVWDYFPIPDGTDPVAEAHQKMSALFSGIRAFSAITIPFELMPSFSSSRGFASALVHSQVEKFGVHAETITATSIAALAEHLSANEVSVDPSTLATLEPYVDGRHVIIAVWVASAETVRKEFGSEIDEHMPAFLRDRRPCIYAEFPSDQPFFPMRPTRAYGDVTVPLRLFVTGLVRPSVGPDLLDAFKMRVVIRDADEDSPRRPVKKTKATAVKDPPALFRPSDAREMTIITADLPATAFTDDLRFEPHAPASYVRARIVSNGAVFAWFPLVALFSYLAAGIAGVVMFGRWRKTAPLGLYLFATFFGLALFLRNHRLAELSPAWKDHSEVSVRRRFIVWTVFFYLAITSAVQVWATVWLGM
ncbi:MAG: hypothetical protein AMXMBFR47_33580 [Planctomycetota bacterium]